MEAEIKKRLLLNDKYSNILTDENNSVWREQVMGEREETTAKESPWIR